MDNNIKFDKVNISLSSGKIEQNVKKADATIQREETAITDTRSKLANLLTCEDDSSELDARVVEIKNRIQINDYKVDLTVLSDKLISSGVLRTSGE